MGAIKLMFKAGLGLTAVSAGALYVHYSVPGIPSPVEIQVPAGSLLEKHALLENEEGYCDAYEMTIPAAYIQYKLKAMKERELATMYFRDFWLTPAMMLEFLLFRALGSPAWYTIKISNNSQEYHCHSREEAKDVLSTMLFERGDAVGPFRVVDSKRQEVLFSSSEGDRFRSKTWLALEPSHDGGFRGVHVRFGSWTNVPEDGIFNRVLYSFHRLYSRITLGLAVHRMVMISPDYIIKPSE